MLPDTAALLRRHCGDRGLAVVFGTTASIIRMALIGGAVFVWTGLPDGAEGDRDVARGDGGVQ